MLNVYLNNDRLFFLSLFPSHVASSSRFSRGWYQTQRVIEMMSRVQLQTTVHNTAYSVSRYTYFGPHAVASTYLKNVDVRQVNTFSFSSYLSVTKAWKVLYLKCIDRLLQKFWTKNILGECHHRLKRNSRVNSSQLGGNNIQSISPSLNIQKLRVIQK